MPAFEDLALDGKRVVVRVDFNVPLQHDETGRVAVADDTRIRAALPTLRAIIERGGTPILLSHLGRPKDEPDPALSLEPVAAHLQSVFGEPVAFLTEERRDAVDAAVEAGARVVVMENTRFHPGEKANDPALAGRYAALGDVFVNDAFGAAHRAHASTAGITEHMATSAPGLLMERELRYLGKALASPARPFVAVLGGAKVSDKIGVIQSLLPRVDRLLIGGAMSYTFLLARSLETGTSLVEPDRVETAKALLEQAGGKMLLPSDHVAADSFDDDAPHGVSAPGIPRNRMGLDIGPQTIEEYAGIVRGAGTVVWNGPMGVFEMPHFAAGTMAIARAMVEATNAGATTIVGGGDSVAAIAQAGLSDRVSHVSTGGGAMLEFLEGKVLPGVAALESPATHS